MSRAARALAITAAWALPAAWVVTAASSGPSDGTTVSPPAVLSAAPDWSDGATVVRTLGETPLRPGDVVRTIDGRAWQAWLSDPSAAGVATGDTIGYGIRRPSGALALELTVDVTLTDFPAAAAVGAAPAALATSLLALVTGSLLVWRRPSSPPDRAFLAAASLVACGLTAAPLGVAAIDLAGGRGLWPYVGGQVAFAAGTACAVAVAVTLVGPAARPRWAWAAVTGPLLGWGAWAMTVALPRPDGPAQAQALLTIAGPATLGALVAALVVLLATSAHTRMRSDRLAARLLLLVVVGAVGVRLLLVDLPALLLTQPLVPSGGLTTVLVATVLAGAVAALVRYRLEVAEPAVRRALLQATLAAVVGGAFLAGAGAVDRASDRSFESMLAGGVIALLVLPVALGAQRWLRRRINADRDPGHLVAELRRLRPTAAPEEALRETLTLLAERLHLSYAAIQITGDGPDRGAGASVGEPRDTPMTIELVAGGHTLGRLLLEAGPDRAPFGEADRRLLEDVGTEVGALVQAVLTSAELQRSRQRLITTREEERRRLRRDLHDGLGPSLATMAMRLETARDLIADDPEAAAELVGRLSDRARDDITEVRRLVDGLRPPALDQLGLVSALRQRADEHGIGAGGEAHVEWSVVAAADIEPLPAAVEVAAYRIATEAVTNAVRHSGATSCEVNLRRADGWLELRVSDDGQGLAATPGVGVGLTSMRERAEEVGGSCTVTDGQGAGTVVEARLPLGEEGGP